jgi:hypothetical protein
MTQRRPARTEQEPLLLSSRAKRGISFSVAWFATVAVAPALHAQKLFEGTITYEVTPANGTPVEMTLRSNGKKLREDMRAPETGDESTTYQVIDGESGEVLVVIPAAKQYMLHNFKTLRAEREKTTDSTAVDDIVSTGRKETIVGLSCEVYVRKDQPGNEWCITSALGRLGVFDDQLAGSNAMSGTAMQLFKHGALVLRMSYGASLGYPVTMIATKIDRTSPPASIFKVPAGYTEMKNPMMPKP